MQKRILVTGAGGFIGHHLVNYLKDRNHWVRGADIKYPEFTNSISKADEFDICDLRKWRDCLTSVIQIDEVYNLAANMGGMGFISSNHSDILHDNLLINIHMLEAASFAEVSRYLYTSSACIYPEHLQTETEVTPLKEEDAYPAMPQDAYGWEKLVSERLNLHYADEGKIQTRIVRFHNIFGPLGTYDGGREKVPAALCRKIAYAKIIGNHEIEIWGDGEQTRSFCYIDDCVQGIYRLMNSNYYQPLNLGQDRMVSINQLADIIADIAGIKIIKKHVDGPQGVRGRNSDNTLLKNVLDWEPKVSLEDGLAITYKWIEDEVRLRFQ